MWRPCPQSNVGIGLELSGLLLAAPDSPEWLAEFQRRGLPDTAWAHSGGGEGHRHYYYRRPEDCSIWRINKSGEYDIQTAGYAVAPPSVHRSGRKYTWVQPFPDNPGHLPFAPDWVVDLLVTAANRHRSRPAVASTGGAQEATLPDQYGLKWWNGDLVKTNPDGEVDRSATLYAIGGQLARGGTSATSIADALAERDATLGFNKYTSRPEEYQRIAEKVLADISAHSLRPVPMAPMGSAA